MKTVFFPSHLDSGNRGCEAITKGTCKILGNEYRFAATTQNPILDSTMSYQNVFFSGFGDKTFMARVCKKLAKMFTPAPVADKVLFKCRYGQTFKNYSKGDVILSTGGDMFCYGENLDTIRLIDHLHSEDMKVVLWGCSIGEENLTPRKTEVLRKFSAVTVRESLSETVLKEKVGLHHVYRFPDPAFVLEPEICELPEFFLRDVVGINLSNFVGANVDFDTLVGKNLMELFEKILSDTNMDIVLFPHVFWQGQDDRIVCNAFYERFKMTGRVHVLDTESKNYCQIRYAISKCRFFIGARTHAMISAYATCVPALALGYSIKAIGIAKDIGLPKELVTDYRTLEDTHSFSNAFAYLFENEAKLKEYMCKVIPAYKGEAYKMKHIIQMVSKGVM